jgi:hypothetical protein
MSLILNFWDISIDYKNIESVNVKFIFDVVMDNGNVINYDFYDTYKRNYMFYEREACINSPEKFGLSDWN